MLELWLIAVIGGAGTIYALRGEITYQLGKARLLLGARRDAMVHECGHAMLFAAIRNIADPQLNVVVKGRHRYVYSALPRDFMNSNEVRRWVMLICLAGQAAEIAAGRNAHLASNKSFQELLATISGPSNDVAKWTQLANEHIDAGDDFSLEQADHLSMLWEEDMAALTEFFAQNLALLKSFANALSRSHGHLHGVAVNEYLSRVQFTDRVSPNLLASASVEALPS